MAEISATPASGSSTLSARRWQIHLAILAVLLTVLVSLNWGLVASAISVWRISPTFSHCFLIIPVSALLIWQLRHELAEVEPSAMPSALLWGIPIAIVQFIGAIASITEIQQLAFVGIVQVLTAAVFGKNIYRIIFFPMCYLFFLVPMGEYLVGPLQSFTSQFISLGLSLMGILHHTEGTIIELANGAYQVAEACAGLRFLIATIATGALFCYLNFSRPYKIALYMLASAVVPVIANGFRALGIVLLAHYSNNTIAVGADHLIYGWGFSVAILALLMVIGFFFADPVPPIDIRVLTTTSSATSSRSMLFVIASAVLIVCAVPIFLYWNNHRPAQINEQAFEFFPTSGDWVLGPPSGYWSPNFIGADAIKQFGLKRSADNKIVDVALYYYARSRNGHGLISSSNTFWDEDTSHRVSEQNINVRLGDRFIPMTALIISSQKGTELIWWTYWANSRFTTSALSVKLGSFQTLLGGAPNSALFAVSTFVDGNEDSATARLTDAMIALGAIPERLRLAALPPENN